MPGFIDIVEGERRSFPFDVPKLFARGADIEQIIRDAI